MYYNIGDFEFTKTVDATDPCYDRSIYSGASGVAECGVADISLVPGLYTGYADINDEDRCSSLVVAPAGSISGAAVDEYLLDLSFDEIGIVGVDAGVAGIFQDKPDFQGDEWLAFVHSEGLVNDGERYWLTPYGFCTNSGYGDGGYPLYAYYDGSGNIIALEIRYI